MITELIKEEPANEQVVIVDECGDSLWDAVLGQEIKVCEIKSGAEIPAAWPNREVKSHESTGLNK